ncbi:hypothetical protein [Geodermatophilus sp. SYSU D00700]
MSVSVAIQLDAVQALGEELAALAGELSAGADLCASTAVPLDTAAPGEVSAAAGLTGRAWARVVADCADGADAAARALLAAVQGYRLTDAALSDRVLAARTVTGAGAGA